MDLQTYIQKALESAKKAHEEAGGGHVGNHVLSLDIATGITDEKIVVLDTAPVSPAARVRVELSF